MKIQGQPCRTIWPHVDDQSIEIIDQTRLPHSVATIRLRNLHDVKRAICEMQVRGAPLIGVTAAYGIALAMVDSSSDESLANSMKSLLATRPTAVNLRWAIDRMRSRLAELPQRRRVSAAWDEAARIASEDVFINSQIGLHGAELIRAVHLRRQAPVNVLTHCNAGWLATVDRGTALAPVYAAADSGVPVHVWVDETRPRNQGSSLTAWELGENGVPHTLIVDNAGGHLMQHGMVDMVIVGCDRVTASGDVCNKIGTYLKALAANDNNVPFYVAAPTPTIDWQLHDGVRDIPIEERASEEVTHISGRDQSGRFVQVQLAPPGTPAANFGFDVTPARLVSGLITERGVFAATTAAMRSLRRA